MTFLMDSVRDLACPTLRLHDQGIFAFLDKESSKVIDQKDEQRKTRCKAARGSSWPNNLAKRFVKFRAPKSADQCILRVSVAWIDGFGGFKILKCYVGKDNGDQIVVCVFTWLSDAYYS